jgi:hypothetical protein
MNNPETDTSLIVAIAGKTSTAKTRTTEMTTNVLRNTYDIKACCMSVGDVFRYLTQYVENTDDPDILALHARKALENTSVSIDESTGRIRLISGDTVFRQNMKNGHNAGRFATNNHVVYHVNEFIHERISGHQEGHDIVIFDGREPRDAQILFIPHATDETRVAIYKHELPEECLNLDDTRILDIIRQRDRHEKPLTDALNDYDVNVVNYQRQGPTVTEDIELGHAIAHVIVDFKNGRMGNNFGTINLL